MRKERVLFVIAIFAAITYWGCGLGNGVRVEKFSPGSEVPLNASLTFEFNKNIAPADKVDEWITDELVEFEPAVKGKYKWTAPNILVFVPDVPLQPVTGYTANVTDKVLYSSGYSSSFSTIEFHTPDFKVVKADVFWTNIPHEYYKVTIQANLRFSYPVQPARVKEHLRVFLGGNEVKNFTVLGDNASDQLSLNLGEVSQKDKAQEIRLEFSKGMLPVIGKGASKQNQIFSVSLPPVTELAVTGCASGFDGAGWIEIGTSQMIDEQKAREFITLEPAKDYRLTVLENLFRIEGDFSQQQGVTVKIKKGLPGLFGGTLKEDYEQLVSMVDIEPGISFSDRRGRYLLYSGERNLAVDAVNIPEAEVEVAQIFKNNVPMFVNQNVSSYYYEGSNYYYAGDFGKAVYTKKVNLKSSRNWLEKFTVNLKDLDISKNKGLYLVTVRSANETWKSDSKIVAVTDLGIIARKSNNELLVFVNSISTAKPVAGVTVKLHSQYNQELLSGTTNGDGVALFRNISGAVEGNLPRVITAENDADFNYMSLDESFVETSRFDVGGNADINPDFKVFLYGDRALYRPGEPVHFTGIIRTSGMKLPGEFPVIIKAYSPGGGVAEEFRRLLNEEGSFELTYKVPSYARTGEYAFEVYAGPEKLIGSYGFRVEEFQPDKIRVDFSSNKEKSVPGDNVQFSVNAAFLFGAQASGLRWESTMQLRQRPFTSKRFPELNFSSSGEIQQKFENIFNSGTLSESGSASFLYNVPANLQPEGIIGAYATVSVFDLTGRTVNRVAGTDIYPRSEYVGMQVPGYFYGTGATVPVNIAVVDKNDNTLGEKPLLITLVRYEWQSVLRKDYSGRFYYASEEKEITEWTKPAQSKSGLLSVPVVVSRSGKYQVRVQLKNESRYVKQDVYVYGLGTATASSFPVDREGRVEIVTDKSSYKSGERAKLLFTTPFSGKMLVTFENRGVVNYRYLEVKNNSAEMSVTLPESFVPNIYVTATLFRPHSAVLAAPFFVGHGIANITVEKSDLKLPVTITAPAKIKPGTSTEVVIKTVPKKDVMVTIAAVDEGILQIRDYKTPAPYQAMYAKRPLAVEGYDIYKLLLPEVLSLSSSPGGDGLMAAALKKRINPMANNRFNLVSVWSGIRKTGADGTVRFPVKIPDFTGEIRLMAVAYTGERFGSADKPLTVSDDIILEPSVPRFLSSGDSLASTVSLINTTDKPLTVTLSTSAGGAVKLLSGASQQVTVPAKGIARGVCSFRAVNIGEGQITFAASGPVSVKNEIKLPVRPASPFVVESGYGTLSAGETRKVTLPSGFLQGTASLTLTMSRFPAVKFARQLKDLLGYPYGCAEQTVSRAFPLLYFDQLAKLAAPGIFARTSAAFFVKEGINRIEGMQRYDGSIAYWEGGDYTNTWVSVYAAHFLVEAGKAGYQVNQNALNKLLNYVARISRQPAYEEYTTYSGNTKNISKIVAKQLPYALYVLALAGRGDLSGMNYYKARLNMLSSDGSYLLAGAYALMGKWNTAFEVMPKEFKAEFPARLLSGNFDSGLRTNALKLNVLMDVDPSNKQVPVLIRHLTSVQANTLSTQEASIFFVALGKAAARGANAKITVKILQNGKQLASFNGGDLSLTGSQIASGEVTLKADGSGEVFYFWSAEGVKSGGSVTEKDSYLKARRVFYDYKSGRQITDNTFYQGQLILCAVSVSASDRDVDNVAVSDLIPAGFEIDNPRLAPSAQLQWLPVAQSAPQYMDIRDDRMLYFTTAPRGGARTFYYLARAVAQGRYKLAPVGAEAMYDASYSSYSGGSVIRIIKPGL